MLLLHYYICHSHLAWSGEKADLGGQLIKTAMSTYQGDAEEDDVEDEVDDEGDPDSTDAVDGNDDENEVEDTDLACGCCGSTDSIDEIDEMLLCDGDGCSRGYHMRCLSPPLSAVPDDEWLCPICTLHAPSKSVPEAADRAWDNAVNVLRVAITASSAGREMDGIAVAAALDHLEGVDTGIEHIRASSAGKIVLKASKTFGGREGERARVLVEWWKAYVTSTTMEAERGAIPRCQPPVSVVSTDSAEGQSPEDAQLSMHLRSQPHLQLQKQLTQREENEQEASSSKTDLNQETHRGFRVELLLGQQKQLELPSSPPPPQQLQLDHRAHTAMLLFRQQQHLMKSQPSPHSADKSNTIGRYVAISPDTAFGLAVISANGSILGSIEKQSGAQIQIQKADEHTPRAANCSVTIKGREEQQQLAEELISAAVADYACQAQQTQQQVYLLQQQQRMQMQQQQMQHLMQQQRMQQLMHQPVEVQVQQQVQQRMQQRMQWQIQQQMEQRMQAQQMLLQEQEQKQTFEKMQTELCAVQEQVSFSQCHLQQLREDEIKLRDERTRCIASIVKPHAALSGLSVCSLNVLKGVGACLDHALKSHKICDATEI